MARKAISLILMLFLLTSCCCGATSDYSAPGKPAPTRDRVESQFSAWDGSHPALTRLIKSSMHDPSSYEHVSTYFRDAGSHIVVETTFRGTNAFGAVVINEVLATVDFEGNVIAIISQSP